MTDIRKNRSAAPDTEHGLDLEVDAALREESQGVHARQLERRTEAGEVDNPTVLPGLPLVEAVAGNPVG